MKHTIVLLVAVFVILATGGVVATAQQPKKVFRIGYLSNADPATDSARAERVESIRALLV